MRIGVFDSGIGGLTVLKRLVKDYPNNEYIYYGDTKNLPYGDKTKEELLAFASNIIDFLISKNVEAVIIACGTVSSNILDILKNKYNIKIFDIISPTIYYINNSTYKKIGILATEATVNSKIFSNNIYKNIKEVPCKAFVPLIESNNGSEIDKYIKIYLKDLTDRDLIVLGCTHYPLIKDKLLKYLNKNIKVLDMAECIKGEFENYGVGSINLYFSKLDDNVIKNVSNILNFTNYKLQEKKLYNF